jgi:hypothetical protein
MKVIFAEQGSQQGSYHKKDKGLNCDFAVRKMLNRS